MMNISNTKHELLLRQLESYEPITHEGLELVQACFQTTEAKKGDLLVRQGSLVNKLYFINSGYARSYFLNDEGEEFTTSLAQTGQMMSSFEGFQKGVKSSENIQALTDCNLLVVTKSDYDRIYREVVPWSKFCSGFYERAILQAGERLLDMQRLTASQRYEKLLVNRPEVAMNVPVKHLASYLGIQPQSLSRIRAQKK